MVSKVLLILFMVLAGLNLAFHPGIPRVLIGIIAILTGIAMAFNW